jgi:adenylate kinase
MTCQAARHFSKRLRVSPSLILVRGAFVAQALRRSSPQRKQHRDGAWCARYRRSAASRTRIIFSTHCSIETAGVRPAELPSAVLAMVRPRG